MHHWSALAAVPLEVPEAPALREMLRHFVHSHPHSRLSMRIDRDQLRWHVVPESERDAWADAMVVVGDEIDRDQPEPMIERHRPPLDHPSPVRVVLGPSSVVVYLTHAYGDAATFTELVQAMINADESALVRLSDRGTVALVARGLLKQPRAIHRGWFRHTLRALAPQRIDTPPRIDPARTVQASEFLPAPTSATQSPRPTSVGTILTNAEIRGLTKWRNEHARGVSITAVLASRVAVSFLNAGLDLDATRFYSLFDVRSLVSDQPTLWGNFGKSLELTADLTQPASIDAAMRETIASRRALPGMVVGAVASRVRGLFRTRTQPEASGPMVMTFNSMPTLPGLDNLPWRAGQRRYYGLGYPTGPTGLSVFAVRFRDRMEITVSFDRLRADPELVQTAVHDLSRSLKPPQQPA